MLAVAHETVSSPVRIALPGGLWRGGTAPLREVGLRPLSDADQTFALDLLDQGRLPSERATALLQRCLVDATEDAARQLTIGDREALLLQLRRLNFGDAMDCVLRCPAPDCGGAMEVTLRVGDLLSPAYSSSSREHRLQVDHEGARYELQFRLPTSADLDHAAAMVRESAELASMELLERCVVSATRDGQPVQARALPAAVRDLAAAAMAELDPLAEIQLDLACPSCAHVLSVVFDTGMFLLQEIEERASRALREVHVLASHYGWGEREILQMPARRRARYIGLIAEAQARARAR